MAGVCKVEHHPYNSMIVVGCQEPWRIEGSTKDIYHWSVLVVPLLHVGSFDDSVNQALLEHNLLALFICFEMYSEVVFESHTALFLFEIKTMSEEIGYDLVSSCRFLGDDDGIIYPSDDDRVVTNEEAVIICAAHEAETFVAS